VVTALACLFNGGFVAWNIATLSADRRVAKAQTVADANLQQAERKWMACHRSEVYTVGTDIYLADTKKSQLTTAQVPEIKRAM
jgi:hypothetical protein